MSERPAEDVWSTCQHSLNDSVITENDSEVFKSRPSCSCKAGTHVFYEEDDFVMRNMVDCRFIVQSWCQECRLQDGMKLN